jgi:hypothetical protein
MRMEMEMKMKIIWFDFSSLQVQLTEERKKMKTQEKTDKVGGNICEI